MKCRYLKSSVFYFFASSILSCSQGKEDSLPSKVETIDQGSSGDGAAIKTGNIQVVSGEPKPFDKSTSFKMSLKSQDATGYKYLVSHDRDSCASPSKFNSVSDINSPLEIDVSKFSDGELTLCLVPSFNRPVESLDTTVLRWMKDTRPPGLELSEKNILTNKPTPLKIDSADAVSVSWTVKEGSNSGIAIDGDKSHERTLVGKQAGIYKIRIEATDRAENKTFRDLQFEFDNVAPSIVIETFGVYNQPFQPKVNITGSSVVKWEQVSPSPDDCQLDIATSDLVQSRVQPLFPMVSQGNCPAEFSGKLKIIATDAVGNMKESFYEFKWDSIAPSFTVPHFARLSSAIKIFKFNPALSTDVSTAKISVKFNPSEDKATLSYDKKKNEVTILARNDGVYRVETTVEDEVGNRSSAGTTIAFDSAPPTISAFYVNGGQNTASPFTRIAVKFSEEMASSEQKMIHIYSLREFQECFKLTGQKYVYQVHCKGGRDFGDYLSPVLRREIEGIVYESDVLNSLFLAEGTYALVVSCSEKPNELLPCRDLAGNATQLKNDQFPFIFKTVGHKAQGFSTNFEKTINYISSHSHWSMQTVIDSAGKASTLHYASNPGGTMTKLWYVDNVAKPVAQLFPFEFVNGYFPTLAVDEETGRRVIFGTFKHSSSMNDVKFIPIINGVFQKEVSVLVEVVENTGFYTVPNPSRYPSIAELIPKALKRRSDLMSGNKDLSWFEGRRMRIEFDGFDIRKYFFTSLDPLQNTVRKHFLWETTDALNVDSGDSFFAGHKGVPYINKAGDVAYSAMLCWRCDSGAKLIKSIDTIILKRP
jgi:hypothetical protein